MARTLGVICARGGSKGFPGKNLAMLDGDPLITHSMNQARGSELLDRWVVSTDSDQIGVFVIEAGWPASLIWRPDELATDDARIEGALQHALKYCEEEEEVQYDYICMLLNTHPLRTSRDINSAIYAMTSAEKHIDSIVSGYWIDHPYELRTLAMLPLNNHYDPSRAYRRQDADALFLGNGAVVVMTRKCLMEKDSIWGDVARHSDMPAWRSQDVDSPEDLKACEIILRGMRECSVSSVEASVARS